MLQHFETKRVSKDGKLIDISLTLSPIKDTNGAIVGASKIARDITEQKLAEEKLRRINEELEMKVRERTFELTDALEREKELSEMKSRFVSMASHEFRTPLTLILSPLRDLQKEFPKRDIFRTMQQNAERLLSLINQRLDLSKLEAGKMTVEIQEADLAQFLRQLFSSFESLAQSESIFFQHEQSHLSRIAFFDADKMGTIIFKYQMIGIILGGNL